MYVMTTRYNFVLSSLPTEMYSVYTTSRNMHIQQLQFAWCVQRAVKQCGTAITKEKRQNCRRFSFMIFCK